MDKLSNLHINLDNVGILVQQELEPGTYVTRFWGEVPAASVIGIVDAVRNRVLDLVLAIQKNYPSAVDVVGLAAKEPAMAEKINQMFYTTIHGNAGVIGNGDNATVNITVNTGNIQDLRTQLSAHGLDETDIMELEAAVKAEPSIEADKKFGPKVTKWVGGMLSKAASGTWGVGLGAAGALLEKALLGYYGYN